MKKTRVNANIIVYILYKYKERINIFYIGSFFI